MSANNTAGLPWEIDPEAEDPTPEEITDENHEEFVRPAEDVEPLEEEVGE